jgi:hypothetical protein
MVTPNAAMGPVYYKIGDWVHFAWNYTSVIVSPTAINAVVSCSAASKTFTVISNQTIEPTGQVFWDSSQVENQLLTNEYTLVVWDAARPITAVPQAGVLAPDAQFTFGMYAPQPYQNWSSKSDCARSAEQVLTKNRLSDSMSDMQRRGTVGTHDAALLAGNGWGDGAVVYLVRHQLCGIIVVLQ